VEDDANLRSLVARVLTGRGYEVHAADTGVAGLAIASDPLIRIDVVITDVVMPGMNGRELVEKLLEGRPGLGCLFMSGYTDDEILRRGVLRGETAFLQKPFTPEQLSQSLRSVLDRGVVVSAA
jgi:two-component system cell cycle sensor histidine kinase/response regulator CckA